MTLFAIALALSLQAAPAEAPVTLPVSPAPLHGTMLAPANACAVAVIIAGSGPTDRDGNNPMGVLAKPYRLLAEALSDRGVATVRYDKRGIAASASAVTDEAALRLDHYIDDARAWARQTAETSGQPCAWLIGHSEGALIALEAAQDNADVCGLVLLSGGGRPLGAVLREQMAGMPEPLKTQAFEILTSLEAGQTVVDTPPALAGLFRPSVQPYFISLLARDPAALIKVYDGPVMIGQGDNDIQVSAADGRALSAAQPRARLVEWAGVNHVLKVAPTDRAGNAATYANAALPLAPGVAEAVADFILDPR